ncbi:hypothetical protein HFP15_39925 [Amycolatopsis sp. K13G38]|uniref:Uncharacterized protein n=1 Tax=Amycolatopsis acididurans TaxID=2724524 RepID=A0ABX1JI34_9PSEU|nr:hypothetical protein [Amycolatopsis acididurans]NKQ59029.1 hypothetical protein [Amycolatopsis acididurans]
MDITHFGLRPLGDYEPPARRLRPRAESRELLVAAALAEERAYRENLPEKTAFTALRELVSDVLGVPPAMG